MTQVIDEIRKVEEESDLLMRTARDEAKRLVEEAQSKGKELSAKAEREARQEMETLKVQVIEEVQEKVKLMEKKTLDGINKLEKAAGKHLDKAVSFIIGRILE